MKFVLNPSLEHIALIKILISLWNQNDVKILMVKLGFPLFMLPTDKEWKEIEHTVIGKVAQLSVPELLREKVLCFIRPIGEQILEWITYHSRNFDIHQVPAEFCWTPLGTMDKKKTAEVFITDKNVDTSTRYKLACIYCLEDDIKKLWNNMPQDLKESLSDKYRIIKFWSRNVWGRELDRVSYGSEFHCAAYEGNQVGAEYFLQKLTPQKGEHYLVDIAKNVRDSDVLCFLLSQMNEEQQIRVFQLNPSGVLRCFLQWPLQSFFIRIANCMWDFLSPADHHYLLRSMIEKITDGYKDWNYQKLFTEFWQKSPDALKNFTLSEIDGILLSSAYQIHSLFHIKDKENIRLILKEATPTVREKLIYSDEMNNFCERSIYAHEWDFLEFCIRECFPSKNEMLKFKEESEKSYYLKSPYFKEHFARNKQKWDQIFISPHNTLPKDDKRSIEESECSSSKRFRSLQ